MLHKIEELERRFDELESFLADPSVLGNQGMDMAIESPGIRFSFMIPVTTSSTFSGVTCGEVSAETGAARTRNKRITTAKTTHMDLFSMEHSPKR